jgi:hypothetical protein
MMPAVAERPRAQVVERAREPLSPAEHPLVLRLHLVREDTTHLAIAISML